MSRLFYRPARRAARVLGLTVLMTVAAAGCSLFNDEEILEGERIKIRSANPAESRTIEGSALPPVVTIEAWPQTNGSPSHNSGHLAGPTSLSRVWSADIGTGGSSDGMITSGPILANGRVYTLDAAARVTAFDAGSGREIWDTDLAPEGEDGDEGFGGGLAFEQGQVYATTGFGEILSLDADTGEITWRKSFGAPFRAAPTVQAGLIFAVARDNQAYAVSTENGEIRWRVQGASTNAGFLGGASPAASGGLVALPFGSGELIGVDQRSGRQSWTALLMGGRRGQARASISDVTGAPLIIGPLVIAGNQSGRLVAIDGRNGGRIWTREIGSKRPLWAAAESLFVMSDDGQLTRVATRNGRTVWATQLPIYEDPEDKEDPINYSGPVLVQGQVLVSDSLGELMIFDADTGEERDRVDLSSGSITGPVVVGGTVYVLSDNGVLEAFR